VHSLVVAGYLVVIIVEAAGVPQRAEANRPVNLA
jgi:hypothetical protein